MRGKDLNELLGFLRMPLERADDVFERFSGIPGAVRRGDGLTQFLFVPGGRENRVLLVAHADTYWDELYSDGPSSAIEQDIHLEHGVIRNRNGGLGADDRAGCAMIWQLRGSGHSILITNGEEHGRRGSTWLMEANPDVVDEISRTHQFVVQLDRRNGRDFKCYETAGTDEFRDYVHRTTGYTEPDRLSYKDIVTLCLDICGVNLSIGYHDEHKTSEYLVVDEWVGTLNMCREWLSRNDLPRFLRDRIEVP